MVPLLVKLRSAVMTTLVTSLRILPQHRKRTGSLNQLRLLVENDGDVLTETVTTTMLAAQATTNDAMNAMEADVTGNVVTAWSLQIDEVAAAPGSNLSQYGQSSGATGGALFAAGEKVVADAQQVYTVNITHQGGDDSPRQRLRLWYGQTRSGATNRGA